MFALCQILNPPASVGRNEYSRRHRIQTLRVGGVRESYLLDGKVDEADVRSNVTGRVRGRSYVVIEELNRSHTYVRNWFTG